MTKRTPAGDDSPVPEIFLIADVARTLRVKSDNAVRSMIARNEIPKAHFRVGRAPRWFREQFLEELREIAAQPDAEPSDNSEVRDAS